ncbi:MAG: hypothetical protein Q4G31_03645 [bacterium]|nr:hypothetical protein [bacterium]
MKQKNVKLPISPAGNGELNIFGINAEKRIIIQTRLKGKKGKKKKYKKNQKTIGMQCLAKIGSQKQTMNKFSVKVKIIVDF